MWPLVFAVAVLVTTFTHFSWAVYLLSQSGCSAADTRLQPLKSDYDDDYMNIGNTTIAPDVKAPGFGYAREQQPVLVIALISNNRYKPLVRLCTSLLEADYSDAKGFFRGGINLVFKIYDTHLCGPV